MMLVDQSDSDRKFHSIAVGISTNSTQEEVDEIFFRALLREVPDLQPTAYLGDATLFTL